MKHHPSVGDMPSPTETVFMFNSSLKNCLPLWNPENETFCKLKNNKQIGHEIGLLGHVIHVTGWKPTIDPVLRMVQPIDFIETPFNYDPQLQQPFHVRIVPDTTRCTAWCAAAPLPSGPLSAPCAGAWRAQCGWSLPAVPPSRQCCTTPWRHWPTTKSVGFMGVLHPEKCGSSRGSWRMLGSWMEFRLKKLRSNEDWINKHGNWYWTTKNVDSMENETNKNGDGM